VALAWTQGFHDWPVAALCLVVSVLLQVGVNYSNDYSDGVRGTDGETRVGPLRLVGSGAATPSQVLIAAWGCFGVAAVSGLAICWVTNNWWLMGLGAAAILAAWFYTGGPHPYGYAGLGELFVLIFFGLVAVLATEFVLGAAVDPAALAGAFFCGLGAVAVLMVNNLRDVDSDAVAGKRTLAVRVGQARATTLFSAACAGTTLALALVGVFVNPWLLLALVPLVPLWRAWYLVAKGARGMALVPAIKLVSLGCLAASIVLFALALVVF
jgi:1,4-dihydroxy-2-naphthoate octaprenyltransferase